jgi:hypothetical protein
MCLYVNVGSAALLSATGACIVVTQKSAPSAPDFVRFCNDLSNLNWLWSPISYMGYLGIILGLFGVVLSGGYTKKS